jgi:hypothetical protein
VSQVWWLPGVRRSLSSPTPGRSGRGIMLCRTWGRPKGWIRNIRPPPNPLEQVLPGDGDGQRPPGFIQVVPAAPSFSGLSREPSRRRTRLPSRGADWPHGPNLRKWLSRLAFRPVYTSERCITGFGFEPRGSSPAYAHAINRGAPVPSEPACPPSSSDSPEDPNGHSHPGLPGSVERHRPHGSRRCDPRRQRQGQSAVLGQSQLHATPDARLRPTPAARRVWTGPGISRAGANARGWLAQGVAHPPHNLTSRRPTAR